MKIYENDEFTIYDHDDNQELFLVCPKDDKINNYYTDKLHVQKLIKEGEKTNKSIYERVLNLRNRISLDGDDIIYEEDHLLLDEVLDYIENNEQKAQEETYNDTVDVYKELEAGAIIKKQEKLLELYKELSKYVDEQTYAHELPEITRLKNTN